MISAILQTSTNIKWGPASNGKTDRLKLFLPFFGYSCTDSSFQVSYLLACTVRVHSLLSCWVTGAVLCLHFAHATNAIAMPITITNPIPTTQSPKLLVASDCSVVVVVVAVVVTSSMHCVSFVGPTQPPVHSAHL